MRTVTRSRTASQKTRTPFEGVPLVLRPGGHILVIGAGSVGLRKCQRLVRTGVPVWLVDRVVPRAIPARIHFVQAEVTPTNLKQLLRGAGLVVAATNDPKLNAAVGKACLRAHLLVDVVTEPSLGNVIMPAVSRQGPVMVAISTSGTDPRLARKLRKIVDDELPAWIRKAREQGQ